MDEQREISKAYLNKFIEFIKKGSRVTFVETKGLLAVEHPTEGYLVLEIKDKVVD